MVLIYDIDFKIFANTPPTAVAAATTAEDVVMIFGMFNGSEFCIGVPVCFTLVNLWPPR